MNEIKLSGKLTSVCERDGNGQKFLSAMLEFDGGQTILLVAAGNKLRQLEPFDSEDHVRVTGRLAMFKENFAVLIDECLPTAALFRKSDIGLAYLADRGRTRKASRR